jgi:hypothetical protein
MDSESQLKETPPCEHCGKFDAVQLGDRWLCVDCYAVAGACCALKSQTASISPSDVPRC